MKIWNSFPADPLLLAARKDDFVLGLPTIPRLHESGWVW